MRKPRKRKSEDAVKIQGFGRVQICEYGPNGEPGYRVVSDTGYVGPNTKTQMGFQIYINYVLGGSAGSSLATAIGLGTGGSITSTMSTLPSESWTRKSCVYALVSSSQARWTASWDSSLCSASGTIGNIGMFGSMTGNNLAWGVTTPAQTWATNQSVNVTYLMNFS